MALARGLIQYGASVVLNRRDKATLKKAAISLKAETGAKLEIADFDVTEGEAVKQGVSAIERDIGAIDIMINNAGMQVRSPAVITSSHSVIAAANERLATWHHGSS